MDLLSGPASLNQWTETVGYRPAVLNRSEYRSVDQRVTVAISTAIPACYLVEAGGLKSLRRFRRSRKGMSPILAETLMVLIVIVMSVIVFIFATGTVGGLLTGRKIAPENFSLIAAGAPFSGGFDPNSIHPNGSPPGVSTSGTVCTSSSPITTPVSGVYVPPGQSCTFTASVSSGVVVNYGATLIVQGTSVIISGGIKDNSSSSITIQGGATVSGGINLYGTGNFYLTGSQVSSGSVVLNGVKY